MNRNRRQFLTNWNHCAIMACDCHLCDPMHAYMPRLHLGAHVASVILTIGDSISQLQQQQVASNNDVTMPQMAKNVMPSSNPIHIHSHPLRAFPLTPNSGMIGPVCASPNHSAHIAEEASLPASHGQLNRILMHKAYGTLNRCGCKIYHECRAIDGHRKPYSDNWCQTNRMDVPAGAPRIGGMKAPRRYVIRADETNQPTNESKAS